MILFFIAQIILDNVLSFVFSLPVQSGIACAVCMSCRFPNTMSGVEKVVQDPFPGASPITSLLLKCRTL